MKKSFSISFEDIPVGLTNDILDTIGFVAENIITLYSNKSDINSYNSYRPTIEDTAEIIDMIITYDIEEEMCYSFEAFLNKYVSKLIENYTLLNNCWELEAND